MARAGDGGPRSGQRRRGETITIRVTPEEKAELNLRARRAGHASLSAWAIERLQQENLSLRRRIVLTSQLARHATDLQDLAGAVGQLTPRAIAARLAALAANIPEWQHGLMGGDSDAG